MFYRHHDDMRSAPSCDCCSGGHKGLTALTGVQEGIKCLTALTGVQEASMISLVVEARGKRVDPRAHAAFAARRASMANTVVRCGSCYACETASGQVQFPTLLFVYPHIVLLVRGVADETQL
jgi:hypothetical protein